MITENLSTLKIHKLSQTQYERELAAGNLDKTALYLTPDEEIDLSSYATVEQLNNKADADHTHSYNSLSDKPAIPVVTAEDNGKFIRVVDGAWAAVAVGIAEEASF